jgi:hypothetical protein
MRFFGAAVAFGFAALWIMASLAAAIVCLLSAVAGYGTVLVAESMRAHRGRRRSSPTISPASTLGPPRQAAEEEHLPLWADALRSDLGHVYEPAATTSPLSREAAYGWPLDDETSMTRETLH